MAARNPITVEGKHVGYGHRDSVLECGAPAPLCCGFDWAEVFNDLGGCRDRKGKAAEGRRTPKPGGVRSTDMLTWEDWQTMDLEDNTCEAIDLTTGQSKYFYRAVEATQTATE